jgi:hypothetical protein
VTLRFRPYLSDKIERSEAGQEQAGPREWADDRFRSIKREVWESPRMGAGRRQSFRRNLQQFDGGDERSGRAINLARIGTVDHGQQITERLSSVQYTGLSRQPE